MNPNISPNGSIISVGGLVSRVVSEGSLVAPTEPSADTALAEALTADRLHWGAQALSQLDGIADPQQSDIDQLVLEMCVRYEQSFLGMPSAVRRLFVDCAEGALTNAVSELEGRAGQVETEACSFLADECVEVTAP